MILIFIILQTVILNAKELDTQQNHISNKNSSVIQTQKKNKVKVKRYSNGLTVVKCMIRNKMLTKAQAKEKNIPQNFIKNVRLLEGDNIVYNATLTPYLSKNPILKFKYFGANASVLRLETIDNYNKFEQQDNKIKISDRLPPVVTMKKVKERNQGFKATIPSNILSNSISTPYTSINPFLKFNYYGNTLSFFEYEAINNKITNKAVETTSIKKVKKNNQIIKISSQAIQKKFGNRNIITNDKIKITAPDVASNPGAIPIKIQTNIKAKSIILFATESDTIATYKDIKYGSISFKDEDLVLVYQYFVQKDSIIDFDIKIKLSYGKNSKIIVIVEAEDGRLYMKERFIPIGICIDSGG